MSMPFYLRFVNHPWEYAFTVNFVLKKSMLIADEIYPIHTHFLAEYLEIKVLSSYKSVLWL